MGRVLYGVRWIVGASVRIVVLSSVDPLHDGDGKREYCDILGLLWGMIWKRKAMGSDGKI